MKKKIYIISISTLLIDQLSKFLIIFFLVDKIELIPHFFSLVYTKNTGGAFSILKGNVNLLSMIGIIALVFILFYIQKTEIHRKQEHVAFGLILGGLAGNLIDRIFRQGVVDFLDFTFFGYSYPVFNIADIAISLGIILLLFMELRSEKYASK